MDEIRRVSPQEAKALIDSGYTYLDVRTEQEYAAGHPVRAENIPLMLAGPGGMVPNPLFLEVANLVYPKDAKLVVGCKSGARSARAAAALVAAGFTNVVDQRAGYDGARNAFGAVTEPGWVSAGLPVEAETAGSSYAELREQAGK